MDPKKNIWDQFRDQADAWDEAPPASAWDRLNARLDAEPPAHPGRPWKPFALPGAGLLLVVLMGFGLLWTAMGETKPVLLAANEVETETAAPPEGHLGDLPVLLDTLMEGEEQQMVDSLPISTDLVQQEEDVEVAPVLQRQEQQYVQEPAYEPWDSLIPDNNFSPYDYGNSDIPIGNMVVTNPHGNVIDTVSSLGQFRGGVHEGVYNAYDNQFLQLNGRRNDVSYRPRGNRRDDPLTLDHFNWLLGSWKREGPSGATHESWQQLDRFTIEGRGFFTVNGDTMVTEKMRIEQRGEKVYYIVAIDTNNRPIKFRLRSSNPGELIFENKTNPYPKEIIVRQDDSNNFSTTLHNGKRNTRKRKEEVRRMKRALDTSQ